MNEEKTETSALDFEKIKNQTLKEIFFDEIRKKENHEWLTFLGDGADEALQDEKFVQFLFQKKVIKKFLNFCLPTEGDEPKNFGNFLNSSLFLAKLGGMTELADILSNFKTSQTFDVSDQEISIKR